MQPAYLGSRPNSPLVKAIIKYGYINFYFTVLETCKPYEVLEREQYWLDLISPEYNLSPTAGSTLGISLSTETKAKLRVAHLGKSHSLETRKLMSETRKGKLPIGMERNITRYLKQRYPLLSKEFSIHNTERLDLLKLLL